MAEQPKTSRLVKRTNGTIPPTLSAFIYMDHDDVDCHLPAEVFDVSTVRKSNVNISPFQLMHGRLPLLRRRTSSSGQKSVQSRSTSFRPFQRAQRSCTSHQVETSGWPKATSGARFLSWCVAAHPKKIEPKLKLLPLPRNRDPEEQNSSSVGWKFEWEHSCFFLWYVFMVFFVYFFFIVVLVSRHIPTHRPALKV